MNYNLLWFLNNQVIKISFSIPVSEVILDFIAAHLNELKKKIQPHFN